MAGKTRVLILGGGFGGLYAALEFEKRRDPQFEVTVVNRENFFLFTPMLHEIAASDLDLTNIVNPVRKMIRHVNFFCGDVEQIDVEKKQVVVSHGFDRHSHTLEYDHLVLALGSVTNFFNLPGVAERALTMKSLGDAIQLRNRLIAHLEEADTECARAERPPLLTFIVAGGGFAGVETIASINDFLRDALPFYPNLKEEMLRLVLVHPGEYILPELGEKLGRYADRKLRERGVEIRAKSKVAAVRPNEIELSDGEKIVSSTLVWTAGTSPNPILDIVPCAKERGRIKVNANLQVDGIDGLWALGDCALVPDPATGKYCPPTAQHASREGKVVARNIIATIYGRPKTPFSFKTLGALAAIGRRTGVARILGINFSGFLAWFLWRGIYWSKLPRMEKKVRVAIDWALDVLFTKDLVQFLDQRALAHTQTQTGAALWNREHLSVAGGVDAGNGAATAAKQPGSNAPGCSCRVRYWRFPRLIGMSSTFTAEHQRLEHEAARTKNWKRWGPYLSERQWATVREDYSPYGNCWDYFPHDHARSRAYRWGEDGLLGISDRQCRLCFALALWNANDPILKERLFGLTGSEGNHGEDVKELYYYLDSTPTHSYMKALYKYPQAEYPYARLIEENRRRGLGAPELELIDTGVFNENRYFDVFAEYAKASEDDILIRLTIANRGPEKATLHLLPTLWFRNTWAWGPTPEESTNKSLITLERDGLVRAQHDVLGNYQLTFEGKAKPLFTENETNSARIHNYPNGQRFVKDAFHEYVVHGRADAVNPENIGTKFAAHYVLEIEPGKSEVVRLRLSAVAGGGDAGLEGNQTAQKPGSTPSATAFADFDEIFALRMKEADEFYDAVIPSETDDEAQKVARQGYAGLLWSKQFYHYSIREWLSGDPAQPAPPPERTFGRNREWTHLFNRDVISMPDKWEYPWFAAWDLAFHMIPFSKIDPHFAKKQLTLFLREWYMHPNGQIPAYEFAFGDVNPPVHAWAAWRVYKMTGLRGQRDTAFLESVFQKLLLNFTWWVNRKDAEGNNLFSGGFLGLDNIGVFDRSKPLPTGGFLQQADGTAWMGFYCLTMLSMALELAQTNPVYEDMASKFFEHFISITDAMNSLGGTGLWDEEDGFYYDQLKVDGQVIPLRTRSLVGLMPLIAVENLETTKINKLPGFKKRMEWFLDYRKDLASLVTYCEVCPITGNRMLAIPSRDRLRRALRYMLDENEFLSPYGLRSISRVHGEKPYVFRAGNEEYRVDYVPGEGNSYLFGGNSNWRGPIWFPINFLIVEALERYHLFYGDSFKVECPTGSGNMMTLQDVSHELARRLGSIFLPNENGVRPCHGNIAKYANDPNWRDLVLFYEYFHGETGRGCGASHQTGWTALAVKLLENTIRTQTAVTPEALWSATRPRVALTDVALTTP